MRAPCSQFCACVPSWGPALRGVAFAIGKTMSTVKRWMRAWRRRRRRCMAPRWSADSAVAVIGRSWRARGRSFHRPWRKPRKLG
eukprot:417006-Pyramimonas_sp.AAC.1